MNYTNLDLLKDLGKLKKESAKIMEENSKEREEIDEKQMAEIVNMSDEEYNILSNRNEELFDIWMILLDRTRAIPIIYDWIVNETNEAALRNIRKSLENGVPLNFVIDEFVRRVKNKLL
jgi:hypothetical protein